MVPRGGEVAFEIRGTQSEITRKTILRRRTLKVLYAEGLGTQSEINNPFSKNEYQYQLYIFPLAGMGLVKTYFGNIMNIRVVAGEFVKKQGSSGP